MQFFPLFVCVRARAEMRPVCLLLSQIAPMRDPKITTKGPQWVGWKPCHQPFQHRESPPLLYLWVTPHTSHGDRKGRQSHIFDRNKYFSVLTGLFWPPPTPIYLPTPTFVFLGGEEGRRGSWSRSEQLCGHVSMVAGGSKSLELMNNHKHNAVQAKEKSTFGGNRIGSFSLPTKSPMKGIIPHVLVAKESQEAISQGS